jgi:hypothetical protein
MTKGSIILMLNAKQYFIEVYKDGYVTKAFP